METAYDKATGFTFYYPHGKPGASAPGWEGYRVSWRACVKAGSGDISSLMEVIDRIEAKDVADMELHLAQAFVDEISAWLDRTGYQVRSLDITLRVGSGGACGGLCRGHAEDPYQFAVLDFATRQGMVRRPPSGWIF